MIIADTDVLVDFLRDRRPMGNRIALELTTSSFVTTVITEFKLRSGIRSRREATAVEALVAHAQAAQPALSMELGPNDSTH